MRLLERRIGLLFAIFLLALVMSAARATWLAAVRGDDLRARAVSQQVEELAVPARRGTITDRNGVELAVSEEAVTVFANPLLIDSPAATAAKLAPLVRRPASELLGDLTDRARGFVYLRRKLDPRRGEAVERLGIEGIGTVIEPRRVYPRGSLASQLLGHVGTDNEGLAGLEALHEKTLRGRDGRRRMVKDALGKPISIVEEQRAAPGRDVRLTIDATIQERTEAVLADVGRAHAARGAVAVVLDPRTGEVLALANWPRVDPADIGTAPPEARQNRVVAASFEPGSTFKAFTVAGALEEGLVTPDTTFDLPPEIQVADRRIGEAHDRGSVSLTTRQILAQSSNVGSVKIGLRLGVKRFDRWVRRFGFGSPTGIDAPGESPGIVPRPEDYSGSSLGNLPIGQGIAVTPLQMASGYEAIAMEGVARRPHVVAGERAPGRRVISAPTARRVSRMLEGVLGAGGTGREASVPGYRLAGKTGTAEKPDPGGGYSKSRFVASFIGYAPARDPQVLVAVAVDEPKGQIYGGVVAAPAFEKIVSFVLGYRRIPPH